MLDETQAPIEDLDVIQELQVSEFPMTKDAQEYHH